MNRDTNPLPQTEYEVLSGFNYGCTTKDPNGTRVEAGPLVAELPPDVLADMKAQGVIVKTGTVKLPVNAPEAGDVLTYEKRGLLIWESLPNAQSGGELTLQDVQAKFSDNDGLEQFGGFAGSVVEVDE